MDELVDPDTRGDPQSPLRWTCKSTRQLADALGAQGFQVSDDTVGRLLKQQGYTLQRTLKTEEGAQHPDPDAQFRYINQQAKQGKAMYPRLSGCWSARDVPVATARCSRLRSGHQPARGAPVAGHRLGGGTHL